MNSRILFVDDEQNVLTAYRRLLREHRDQWDMHFTSCPLDAWQRLLDESFDVVVSDVRMPGLSGLALLERIKTHAVTQNLQVIIVTGETDAKLKSQALDGGAVDLLNKPVNRDDLLARLRSAVRIRNYDKQLKRQNDDLEQRVRERTAALNASRIDILWRLGKAAEFRDEETGNHVIRVGSYSRLVAQTMGLDADFCETLFLAAPLHDIGKIGIPDSVLRKPGKLSDEEWHIMRKHCEFGVAILSDDCKFMNVVSRFSGGLCQNDQPTGNPVIELAAIIAECHHEKWNGTGYPHGLVGTEIPLAGRIVAIADVYDALRSERPYKKSFSVEKSLSILGEEAGVHFDPAVVEAFFEAHDQISAIEAEFNDQPPKADSEPPATETRSPFGGMNLSVLPLGVTH